MSTRRLRRDLHKRASSAGYHLHAGDMEVTGALFGPTISNLTTAIATLTATTTTPVQISFSSITGAFKAILLRWVPQYNLRTFDHYEVQVSDDDATWYSLEFDGTDWKDTLNAWTETAATFLLHVPIPHAGTAQNPTGRTLYYRVRQSTVDGTKSDWSASASATTSTIASDDITAGAIYDWHVGGISIANPAISQKPSDNAAMAMLGPKVAMGGGTIDYVALENANIYKNEARVVGPLVEGDQGTLALSQGDLITTDGAVAMCYQGAQHALGHLLLAGKRFIYQCTRNQSPETIYIYAPYSSAHVEWKVDDGSWQSVDAARATVTSQETMNLSDAGRIVRIWSDAPVVITKLGSGGDRFHLIPVTKETMIWRDQYRATWDGSSSIDRDYYFSADTEIQATSIGDGAGNAAEQGMAPSLCGDTYGIPHQITGYELVAVEPCTVRVYYWSGGQWNLHAEHDLTAASRTNPVHISEGESAGSGTPLQSSAEPWLMLGTGPFYARTNDEAADEYALIGYRRDWRQYSFEQTIRALAGINVDGTVKADKVVTASLVAGAVTAVKMAAENFFFTKAVGSENRAAPVSGDVRAYLGKDPAGSQGTTDPVESAIKEHNGENWEERFRAGMRSGGNVADALVSGFFQAGESVLSSLGLMWGRRNNHTFSGEQIVRVAFGNDVLVAVSDAGRIERSTDHGINWSTVTDPFGTTAIQDVAFGNDVFIAVGWSEKVARSTDDGASWGSLITMPFSSTCIIMTVCYGNGVWLCGGGTLTGDAEIARSINDGVSWTLISNPFAATNRLFALATNGNGTWIAVSEAGEIARSINDGASFSLVSDPFGATMIRCAAYGGGVFIVAGEDGKLSRSIDNGATWSALIDAGFGSSLILCLAYGGGIWIATGEDGKISRSVDGGLSWGAQVYGEATVQHPFGTTGYISGVTYDATYGRFVAVGDDNAGGGNPLIATSDWLEAGAGIVEHGANIYGEYIRFSNGIQICWKQGVPVSSVAYVVVYPAAFTSNIRPIVSLDSSAAELTTIGTINASTTGFSVNLGTYGSTRSVQYIAWGWWR